MRHRLVKTLRAENKRLRAKVRKLEKTQSVKGRQFLFDSFWGGVSDKTLEVLERRENKGDRNI